MSRDGAYWLRKRVRVGAACDPAVTMAEGVVIGYMGAPSVIVRDAHGRDSTWMVTLPIDVLGEVEDAELPAIVCGGRAVDTGSVWIVWDFDWVDHSLIVKGTFATELEAKVFVGVEGVGQGWGVQEVALPQRAEPEDVPPIEAELNQILREAGIEYPLGLRGVRDLVNQRDGHRERAEEAEQRLANVREMARRLRVAAGGGVTPGYVLARIESVLDGEVPA